MRRHLVRALLLGVSMVGFGVDALAQSEDAAKRSDRTGIDEIIVTAQRRSESVLSVPLSISAFKSETLRASGVQDLTSLRFNTPGYTTASGSGYTQIYVRGIGNSIYVGADPSVATFIDDVPRVYAAMADQLINVERVEVLKGAQGGLYGRNATGGVVNIITRQPTTDAVIVEARGTYGTRDTLDASAFLNIPLNSNVAANVSVSRQQHAGYVDNKAVRNPYQSYAALTPAEAAAYGDTGQRAFLAANPGIAQFLDAGSAPSELNDQDRWAVDGKLGFTGENLKVVLAGDYFRSRDSSGVAGLERPEGEQAAYGAYTGILAAPAPFGFGLPAAVLPIGYVYPNNLKTGKFNAFAPFKYFTRITDYGGSAKADIDLPGFTLTSITAFRWNRNGFTGEITNANVPIVGFFSDFRRRNFYQELRAVSDGDGPLRWLAGVTYYRETIDNLNGNIILGVVSPDVTTSQTKADAYSIYGQVEYELADDLTMTASARYINEKKTAHYPAQTLQVANGTPFPPVATVAEARVGARTRRLLPSVTVSYALPSGGNIYLRWARGLKTGGPNPILHPAATGSMPNTFSPEVVDTYEAGLRTHLFDRRVQFTSALFYNDYRDLQVTRTYPAIPLFMVNAGSARTYGAEATISWQPISVLTIGANAAYLNARYKDFQFAGNAALGITPFNSSGNRMPFSPRFTGGLNASIDAPVNDDFNLVASALWSFSSKFYQVDSQSEITAQKSYSVVNLRAGLKTSDGKYGAYLSVRNAFNQKYQVFGGFSDFSYYIVPGDRRTILGTIEIKM